MKANFIPIQCFFQSQGSLTNFNFADLKLNVSVKEASFLRFLTEVASFICNTTYMIVNLLFPPFPFSVCWLFVGPLQEIQTRLSGCFGLYRFFI